MSDDGKKNMVRLIPMDPFAVAKYEEERLKEIADWMEGRDDGLSNEDAWARARQRAAERRTQQ